MEIPELEFELGMAVLGGKFTTLEGLLKDIQELVRPQGQGRVGQGVGQAAPSRHLGSESC